MKGIWRDKGEVICHKARCCDKSRGFVVWWLLRTRCALTNTKGVQSCFNRWVMVHSCSYSRETGCIGPVRAGFFGVLRGMVKNLDFRMWTNTQFCLRVHFCFTFASFVFLTMCLVWKWPWFYNLQANNFFFFHPWNRPLPYFKSSITHS